MFNIIIYSSLHLQSSMQMLFVLQRTSCLFSSNRCLSYASCKYTYQLVDFLLFANTERSFTEVKTMHNSVLLLQFNICFLLNVEHSPSFTALVSHPQLMAGTPKPNEPQAEQLAKAQQGCPTGEFSQGHVSGLNLLNEFPRSGSPCVCQSS